MGEFTGWPIEAFDVLLQLEGEPSTETRESCRRDRERLVRQPMVDLLDSIAEVDERYEDFSVWHYGKTAWWWQHQAGMVRIDRNVELGLRFDLDGLWIGGRWGWADSTQVDRYRRAVAAPASGLELAAILEDLRAAGLEIEGEQLKRVPRGYPPDHPRGDLLRHRSLAAIDELGDGDWLHSAAAVARVHAAFERLQPLTAWLADHVSTGPG